MKPAEGEGGSEPDVENEDTKAASVVLDMEIPEKKDNALTEKELRLCDWNKDMLIKILKEMVAGRENAGVKPDSPETLSAAEHVTLQRRHPVLEEVEEVIYLPKFDAKAANGTKTAEDVELSDVVVQQLRSYIETVAAMYKSNPFHNFGEYIEALLVAW